MYKQETAFQNIVRKGEIARKEQFLLFPQCFPLNQIIASLLSIFHIISLFAAEFDEPKIGISGKGFSVTQMNGMVLGMVQHIVGIRQNAGNQLFLLFPQ